jgi:hypothetical protein
LALGPDFEQQGCFDRPCRNSLTLPIGERQSLWGLNLGTNNRDQVVLKVTHPTLVASFTDSVPQNTVKNVERLAGVPGRRKGDLTVRDLRELFPNSLRDDVLFGEWATSTAHHTSTAHLWRWIYGHKRTLRLVTTPLVSLEDRGRTPQAIQPRPVQL